MKAKCITSIIVPLSTGQQLHFTAGREYDVSGLSKDVVINYFETPEAPAKKTTTRKEGEGE